jgi:hypothetical protein
VSLEFAALPELRPSEESVGAFALRTPSAASMFPSGAPALFDEISEPRPADYAVLDLGSGGHWLTSRVFIFSVLLQRMRGLRCVVFVETVGESRRQFIGLATPQEVRWALGRRYPWLEIAYAQAYATALGQHPLARDALVMPPDGMLPASVANSTASSYLAAIFRPAGTGPDQGPGSDTDEWTEIPDYGWEHAKWLDGARAERVLDAVLGRSTTRVSVSSPSPEQAAELAASTGLFIAVLGEPSLRFQQLIDRGALLEDMAKRSTTS